MGMGHDLHQEYDVVREVFDMVDDLCHRHIRKLCFHGPMEDLTETVNLQPAVTAVNLACLTVLAKEGVVPDLVAGHSLGEFTALAASGALRQEDVVRLVLKRGELMHREACRRQGAMAALVGLGSEAVESVVEAAGTAGLVSIANHNAPTQIVITGTEEGVQQACRLACEKKARAIPLKVSGAWHSGLMEGAREEFARYLESYDFASPDIPVVMNVTGKSCEKADEIHQAVALQLTSPVLWVDTMKFLEAQEAACFVEAGPGQVLSGLAKKNLPKELQSAINHVGDMKSLELFLSRWK